MGKKRYHLIDALRGLALLNMLGMHFLYDVNVVFGREPDWYLRPGVYLWQQYICWSFILIAGFSFHWGRKNNLRRGLLLNVCGLVITAFDIYDGLCHQAAVHQFNIFKGIGKILG